MKEPRPCQYVDKRGRCEQAQHGARHEGFKADHQYEPPPRAGFGSQRKAVNPRSSLPKRAQRREEGLQTMQAHREAVRYCEAPPAGIQTPCGEGDDGTLEQSHVIGKGMGGGKDYGLLKTLCRKHHRELDTDRQTFRDAGLSLRAPVPDKVVRRRPRQSRQSGPS